MMSCHELIKIHDTFNHFFDFDTKKGSSFMLLKFNSNYGKKNLTTNCQ